MSKHIENQIDAWESFIGRIRSPRVFDAWEENFEDFFQKLSSDEPDMLSMLIKIKRVYTYVVLSSLHAHKANAFSENLCPFSSKGKLLLRSTEPENYHVRVL